MDDFNTASLYEAKNEWAARLLTIFTPLIMEGFKSIFDESLKLCKDNKEMDKYLMTFQNFITRIPKWNPNVIEKERKRIVERSGCNYLEELVTCVHIIQLKLLTAMRVGQKQKKIDINIPKIDDFIHKTYINVARKIYKNVYLFEINSAPLQIQKYNRELEIIIQECILNTIRDNIPIESILRAYMDETVEEDVVEEIKEQVIEDPASTSSSKPNESTHITENKIEEVPVASSIMEEPVISSSKLTFNDMDTVLNTNNKEEIISAPKTIERLEEISELRNKQRRIEEEEETEKDRIKISDQYEDLTNFDIRDITKPDLDLENDFLLDDIEILT
jgi:hypothetical protein